MLQYELGNSLDQWWTTRATGHSGPARRNLMAREHSPKTQ